MKKIGIIGAGFTGTMTAVQLIEKAESSFELYIINKTESFSKGVAFDPYSKTHLLNVAAAKMSAYPDKPDHFLQWVLALSAYSKKDRQIIANAFLPRFLYGEYLTGIWNDACKLARSKGITIRMLPAYVEDIDMVGTLVELSLSNNEKIQLDFCVMATGNQAPRNPNIQNTGFFNSKNYFQNPWQVETVSNTSDQKPVLIIGNGLTMVDTVLGLLEHKFANEIYSISPNGFNILPHRHSGVKYTALADEFPKYPTLLDIVKLVNKHIKLIREFGISPEPVIDSMRTYTQSVWKNLSDDEKKVFMSRLRHLWGVARHRIPLHMHDKLQQLRIDGKLHIRSGKIVDLVETDNIITLTYFDKKSNRHEKIEFSRVINCTGPESDLSRLDGHFLKSALLKGVISQDELKLGIRTNTDTFEVIDRSGKTNVNLFTLGSNLRGELWETTAVNELRVQAEKLAGSINSKLAV